MIWSTFDKIEVVGFECNSWTAANPDVLADQLAKKGGFAH